MILAYSLSSHPSDEERCGAPEDAVWRNGGMWNGEVQDANAVYTDLQHISRAYWRAGVETFPLAGRDPNEVRPGEPVSFEIAKNGYWTAYKDGEVLEKGRGQDSLDAFKETI